MVNVVKSDLFIEFIYHMLVVERDVRVSIAQVIQDVAEVSSVTVDKVAPVLIFAYVMSTRKHDGKH